MHICINGSYSIHLNDYSIPICNNSTLYLPNYLFSQISSSKKLHHIYLWTAMVYEKNRLKRPLIDFEQ